MKTDMPIVTRLADYAAPEFEISTIDLDFNLEPAKTRVRSVMVVRRLAPKPVDFFLD